MIWLVLFLVLIAPVEARLISEILYNPGGDDNNNEYVEIKLNNLSNYSISDLVSSDNLTLLYFYGGNFSLIVEEGFNYSGISASIYSAGATIGNGLNNDYDVIFLKDKNGSIVEVAYYSSEMGGDNKSLCVEGSGFVECESSPGFEEVNKNFTIKINEFLPDPDGDDSVNEWIELYNYGGEALDLEGLTLMDNSGKKIFVSNINTNNTIIQSKGYLVVRMNNFSGFLNNEGFEKIIIDGVDEVSYSDSKEGLSWSKINNEWKLSIPSPGIANKEVNFETILEIKSIDLGRDKKAKFGELIYVRLIVLRGDTSKKAVKVYIKGNETVSKITSLSLDNRFVENEFTVPVQIKDDCEEKFGEGKYEVIVEGLNEEIREPIDIEASECETEETVISADNLTTSVNKSVVLSSPDAEKHLNSITGNVVYEAKDVTAARSGIYILSISLILLLIYIVVAL